MVNTHKKLLVFLRAYNDIDHIVPVIYKWLSSENVPVDIVIAGDSGLLDDYRINFLKQFEKLCVYHITNFLPKKKEHTKRLVQIRKINSSNLVSKALRVLCKGYRSLRESTLPRSGSQPIYEAKFIKELLDYLMKDVKLGIVILDWTKTNFAQEVTNAAKDRKFITVSLPHGDSPYYNKMEHIGDINYDYFANRFALYRMYDFVVVPNKLVARRFEPHLKYDQIKVLGSPRYNDEWLRIISDLLPEYRSEKGRGKLKIVLFMRGTDYSIFYQELIITIKLLLQFPDVYLIMKLHTRNVEHMLKTPYINKYKVDAPNFEIVYDSVHSASLLKWADVVMHLGTSVVFEAIKCRTPVLSLEYLHPNYSTVAHYIKASEVKCRDQLYDAIETLLKNPNYKFYDEEERIRFIREIIDVTDGNTLDGYVRFLRDCLEKAG